MTRERLDTKVRRADILAAAYSLACEVGFDYVTRDAVAAAACCSTGLVSSYYDMDALKRSVLYKAIELRNWDMMRHCLVDPWKSSVPLPKQLRKTLLGRLGA